MRWRFALPRAGLGAQSPALAPANAPAAPGAEQTRREPQTSHVAPLSLLEPHHQWRAALGSRRRAVRHLQSLLQHRAPL